MNNVHRLRRTAGRVGLFAAALAVLLFAVFPVYWVLATALRPTGEIFTREPTLLPRTITFEHFERVLSGVLIPGTSFWSFLTNSLIVTLERSPSRRCCPCSRRSASRATGSGCARSSSSCCWSSRWCRSRR